MRELPKTGGWWRERNDIFDAGLSAHALLVRFYLSRCSDHQGRSYPGINTIAEKCRIGRSTVKRAIAELQDRGFLSVESRRSAGSSNLYTLCIGVNDASTVLHFENEDTSPHEGGESTENQGGVQSEPGGGSHRTTEEDLFKKTYKQEKKDKGVTFLFLDESHPSYSYPADQLIECYYIFYRRIFESDHPKVKLEQLERAYETIGSVASEFAFTEFDDDQVYSIVYQYFQTKFPNCDYKINHFASEEIIRNRIYEVVY